MIIILLFIVTQVSLLLLVLYLVPNNNKLALIDCPIAKDCKAWFDAGATKSGVYPIKPDGDSPFQVSNLILLL